MTLALPMPEQSRLPTDREFSDALIEFAVQQVEAAVAQWERS
jgi:hypothetical protein